MSMMVQTKYIDKFHKRANSLKTMFICSIQKTVKRPMSKQSKGLNDQKKKKMKAVASGYILIFTACCCKSVSHSQVVSLPDTIF